MSYNLDLLHPQHVEQFQQLESLGIPQEGLDRVYQVYLLLNQIPQEDWVLDETVSLVNEGEFNG